MTELIKSGTYPSFDKFSKDAQTLIKAHPDKYRFVLKPIHKDGKIHLKISDNRTCIQYVLSNINEFKKLEVFIGTVMQDNTTDNNGL
ncbi:unnamed protein product [Bursaphelenchus okinawaensis]|uniref:SRP9 domain-containing protein n=1 Tax=Bursaphelenchus okinawaensis TaxID=465554 RepID=A0A811KQX7_9BILA|nr:unnamed protein product [Bursaphelenchus okinawaensis]CAG9107802.1 unnamed protein product [Bursaphelenchus okinawaensis]